MQKLRRKFLVAGLGLGIAALPGQRANAHPGGLNAQGCHNNRKTGDYHCHDGSSADPSSAALNNSPSGNLPPSAEKILSAQTALKALGYEIGEIDGQPGTKTEQAIKAFERSESWPVVGEINDAAIYRLVVILSEKSAC